MLTIRLIIDNDDDEETWAAEAEAADYDAAFELVRFALPFMGETKIREIFNKPSRREEALARYEAERGTRE